ncbi:MAG: retroviral-like aspartic protease family protein [Thermodesulfobacteriota bacterium]
MKKIIFLIFLFMHIGVGVAVYCEIYKWVDENGTLNFTDDLSKIPEKYRPDIEIRKAPKRQEFQKSPPVDPREKSPIPIGQKEEPQGYEINLIRKHELWITEVILNRRLKQNFVVDTGASFTIISHHAVHELGISIDDTTPFLRVLSISDVLLQPLVKLKSIRVGKAELEDVEALVYTMPNYQGLLGNSFLNKFKVMIDTLHGKMTLFSLKGISSPDYPGGYGKDYWVGQFRFYHQNLEELKRLKAIYESRSSSGRELARINNGIRYFENQLNELERKASLAGVPRNWRE